MDAIAHHEAGHAVALVECRLPLRRVTIEPATDGSYLGLAQGPMLTPSLRRLLESGCPSDGRRARVEGLIVSALAGLHAERRRTGHWNSDGAAVDLANALNLAIRFCGDMKETNAYIAWLDVRTANIVRQPEVWACIRALAKALLKHKTLPGPAARALIVEAKDSYVTRARPGGVKWTDIQGV